MTNEEAKRYAWEFRHTYTKYVKTDAGNVEEHCEFSTFVSPKVDEWNSVAYPKMKFMTESGERICSFDELKNNNARLARFNESLAHINKVGDWFELNATIMIDGRNTDTTRIICRGVDEVIPSRDQTISARCTEEDYCVTDKPYTRWIDGEFLVPDGFAWYTNHYGNLVVKRNMWTIVKEYLTNIIGNGCVVEALSCETDCEEEEEVIRLDIVAPNEDALTAGCANLGISFDKLKYDWTRGEGDVQTAIKASFIVSSSGNCGINW